MERQVRWVRREMACGRNRKSSSIPSGRRGHSTPHSLGRWHRKGLIFHTRRPSRPLNGTSPWTMKIGLPLIASKPLLVVGHVRKISVIPLSIQTWTQNEQSQGYFHLAARNPGISPGNRTQNERAAQVFHLAARTLPEPSNIFLGQPRAFADDIVLQSEN